MALTDTMRIEANNLLQLADCIEPAGTARQVRLAAKGYENAIGQIETLLDAIASIRLATSNLEKEMKL